MTDDPETAEMATDPCECCGEGIPAYRLSAVILDGRIARVCPRCVATQKDRIQLPYAPRSDQGAIQPSTSRDVW
jgi:ribosome-binding protein aMBF1 (putative translation factor)